MESITLRTLFLSTVLTASICLPAFAVEKRSKSYVAQVGETIRIWGWAHFDDNFKTTGFANFKVKGRPKLGAVSIKQEKFTISNSSIEKCIGRKKLGRAVYYTAGSKSGKERFTLVQMKRSNQSEVSREIKVEIIVK